MSPLQNLWDFVGTLGHSLFRVCSIIPKPHTEKPHWDLEMPPTPPTPLTAPEEAVPKKALCRKVHLAPKGGQE